MDINNLQTSLYPLYKDVHMDINRQRKRTIEAHNLATHIVFPRSYVGDFLLVRNPDHLIRHKLSFRFVGPRPIADTVSPLV